MCEFCGNEKDIIFPFQINKCQRCEGEPSLLVAGLGGSRAPSPRPSISHTWRDWKISKPRRLARELFKDRREGEGGEGGEEDFEPDQSQGAMSGEERDDTTEGGEGKMKILKAFTPGRLVKAFSRSKSSEEEQETKEGTESEREEESKCDKGEEEGGNESEAHSRERVNSRERGDVHSKKEKVNLLKVLHMDRLKKSISKGDRKDSEGETCSSMESLDEVGQERKGRWKVSGLVNLTKNFSKRGTEDEGKADVKEEEKMLLEKGTGTEEEVEVRMNTGDDDEISDKGQTAETESAGKFTLIKSLKHNRLPGIFSSGRSRGEDDRSWGSDGKREGDTEEEVSDSVTQANWRGRKTRKARRVSRGRNIRGGTEKESRTEGGERAETHDVDDCAEKGGGQEKEPCKHT